MERKDNNYIAYFAIAAFVLIILFIILMSLKGIAEREVKTAAKTPTETNTTVIENTVEKPVVKEGSESFEMKFLKVEDKKENMIYSPLSIKTALKMLEEGARGNSKEELTALIGTEDVNQYNSVEEKMSFANSLFIRDSYEENVKEEYKKTLEKYNAEIIVDPFENADNINEWIKEKTLGIITNIIKDQDVQDPFTKLVLINALAIDMKWKIRFDPLDTFGNTFTLDDGNKMMATTMKTKVNSQYVKYYLTNNIKAVSMELEDVGDTTLEFIAIMPKDHLYEYLKDFDMDLANEIIDKMKATSEESKEVEILIPKFKYSYDLEFKKDLKKLGINDIFESATADLTGIADPIENLYISNALHKADIEFSEEGIRAAAVTALFARDEAMPLEKEKPIRLEFDKPFVYYIRDKKNKEVWFVGTMYEPNNWENDAESYRGF